MYRRSQRWMLIINNRFLSLYDYNFLLVIEKIWNLEEKYVCKHKVGILFLYFVLLMKSHLQSYPCPLQINTFWNLAPPFPAQGLIYWVSNVYKSWDISYLGFLHLGSWRTYRPRRLQQSLSSNPWDCPDAVG